MNSKPLTLTNTTFIVKSWNVNQKQTQIIGYILNGMKGTMRVLYVYKNFLGLIIPNILIWFFMKLIQIYFILKKME